MPDKMVSYKHANDLAGPTYVQYEKDPLPPWAFDVRPITSKKEKDYGERKDQHREEPPDPEAPPA